jgi:hypothetical protein
VWLSLEELGEVDLVGGTPLERARWWQAPGVLQQRKKAEEGVDQMQESSFRLHAEREEQERVSYAQILSNGREAIPSLRQDRA